MGRNYHWAAQAIRVNIQRQITFHDNIHTWGQFRKKLLNADIVECGRKLERTQHAKCVLVGVKPRTFVLRGDSTDYYTTVAPM